MKKTDEGHRETDELLGKLENRIANEYDIAYKEMAEKADAFFKRFEKRDKEMLAKVKAGKMKESDYLTWRRNQMLTGGRYEAMRDVLAQDCTNANRIAMNMAYDNMKDAYAINVNYGAFEVEKGSQMDTSFTLYDRKTVERLIRDNPDLLPKPRVDVPKDLQWNRKKINSALLQGVLQGDSIPNIAKRLQSVTDMNQSAAVRNARTMTTGAECKGRIDSYKRAEAMGINMEKMWVATLDGRTRHEHRILDGQQVEVNKPFEVDGYKLDCPGDPAGDPEMVYNCRCTVIAVIPDTKVSEEGIGILERDGKYKGMTYEEWKNEKSAKKKPEPEPVTIGNAKTFDDIKKCLSTDYGISMIDEVMKLEFEHVRNAIQGIVDTIEEFPALRGQIVQLRISNSGYMSSNGENICFNPIYFDKDKDYDVNEAYQAGAHETGHCLDMIICKKEKAKEYASISSSDYMIRFAAKSDWRSNVQARKIVAKAISRVKKANPGYASYTNQQLRRAMSNYSTQDTAESLAEAIGYEMLLKKRGVNDYRIKSTGHQVGKEIFDLVMEGVNKK